MFKKLFSACILAAVTLTASAQYKIVSSESQPGSVSCYEMKYILESESSTFIYGTFTSPKDNGTFAFDQTLAIYQNDLKYKVKNSIHIPVWDEAERMYIVVDATGDKVNFVVEFEKFSSEKPFDIIENEKPREGGTYLNLFNVKAEATDYENIPDAGRFLDRYPVTTRGTYKDNGSNVQYINHDGVYVSCRSTWCEGGLFEPDYYRGLRMLSNLANEAAEHNIQEYLASHPKNRPDVLRSQSIASGEGISGYVAVEKKKNDSYVVHVPVDGYDFTFSWN